MLFERKKGEFYDSIQKGLVIDEDVLGREILMRLLLVYRGEFARARSAGVETLFKNYSLEDVDPKNLFMLISIYRKVDMLEQRRSDQKERYRISEWGNGLKYGKLAIAGAIFRLSGDANAVDDKIGFVRGKWLDFEATIANHEHNSGYFSDGFDYANYYKGRTINKDLVSYFDNLV